MFFCRTKEGFEYILQNYNIIGELLRFDFSINKLNPCRKLRIGYKSSGRLLIILGKAS